MSDKPKDTTKKRKKQRKGKKALGIIVAGVIFILLACNGDKGCGKNGVRCTPELPPMPTATPEPIWPGSVDTIHYSN